MMGLFGDIHEKQVKLSYAHKRGEYVYGDSKIMFHLC